LPDEADEGNDLVQLLDAAEDVSDYWEDPQPKHLHILVQKPSGAPSRSLVASIRPSDLHLVLK
jgi:hypothetical protein